MPPLYPAGRRPPTLAILLLATLGAIPPAHADAVFDRAASLSPPPAGAQTVGQGTGFFISGDGTLLTAAHLVQRCRRIDVPGYAPATILQADRAADIAALQVAGPTPALRLASSAPTSDGPVELIGYPEDDPDPQPTHLAGTTLNRQAQAFNPANPSPDIELILQAAIRHGDSGGPILDASGAVIGLIQGIVPNQAEIQASYGLTLAPIAVGPGLSPIRRLLITEGTPAKAVDGAAVVRVLCWN